MMGGSTLVSMEPWHSVLLCSPFNARPVGSKPAHCAVHRLTSRVITLVPHSTIRSVLSGEEKAERPGVLNNSTDRSFGNVRDIFLFNLWLYEDDVQPTWNPFIQ